MPSLVGLGLRPHRKVKKFNALVSVGVKKVLNEFPAK